MPSGLYRGTVTALNGTQGPGLYVKVPKLNDGHAFGPAPLAEHARTIGDPSSASSAANSGAASAGAAHTHPIPHTHTRGAAWAVGDRVLVGLIEGRANDVVVIDRL